MRNKYNLKAGLLFSMALGGMAINGFSQLYPFTNHTFDNCGAEGREGPLLTDCVAAYSGADWTTNPDNFDMTTQGIQLWTVPASGLYSIEAYGAQGGSDTYTVLPEEGGLGAKMEGRFMLTEGQVLAILVGQKGEDTRVDTEDNAAAGGGGGTFVWDTTDTDMPIIVAGGGAGASGHGFEGMHAVITTGGQNSFSLENGGLEGNGGRSNAGGSSYWGGGGAGWLTNGTAGNQPTDYLFENPGTYGSAEGGRRPLEGGLGGVRFNDGQDEGGDGGFGGGGAGGSDNMGTGGGGGYSGGGGENGDGYPDSNSGGGGGSYNSGFDQNNEAGVHAGHGYVVITYLCTLEAEADVIHEAVGADGEIDLNVSMAYGDPVFDWDNDGTGDFDDGEDLTGLSAGIYTVVIKDTMGCEITEAFEVLNTASLGKLDLAQVNVYPNPTKGEVNIALNGQFVYHVLSVSGQILFNGQGYNEANFNLENLSKGVYFVKLTAGEETTTVKVVKK